MAEVASAHRIPPPLIIDDPPDQLHWVYSVEDSTCFDASPQTLSPDISRRRAVSTSCSSMTRRQKSMEEALGDTLGDVDSMQYQLQQLQAQLAAELEARAASEEEAYILESKLLEAQQAAQTAQMQLQRMQTARDGLLTENRMLQEMLFEANEEHQAAEAQLKRALDELEGRSTSSGLAARSSHLISLIALNSEASSACCTAISSSTRDQAVQATLSVPLCLSETNLSCLNKTHGQQQKQSQDAAEPALSDSGDSQSSDEHALTARYTTNKSTAGRPVSPTQGEGVEQGDGSLHAMLAALRCENEDLAGQLVAKSLELAQLRERQEEERHQRAWLETVNLRLMKKVEKLSEIMTDRQMAVTPRV